METPCYLIDESALLRNLQVIDRVRADSGAKSVLALKCFAAWSVFPLLRDHLDGTTSSSLFEARLGHEELGKEVHAYSVGWSRSEILEVRGFADKIIFNSISQLQRFRADVEGVQLGLRVNPGISHSHFDLADPARRFSRLGAIDLDRVMNVAPSLSGVMFHFNCENDDVESVAKAVDVIGEQYGALLECLEWVSLGGGISFTNPAYPLDRFCEVLRAFADRHGVQVYLEPGEAVVTGTTELVTTVLDVTHNEIDVAIVDASVEAHMLDHLIYGTSAALTSPGPGDHHVMIAGRTCLAGDIFGEHRLNTRLQVGDEVRIADAGGYTMVKKNWFNGVAMPSIAVRRLDGTVETVREFGYEDYRRSLS
ncbi:MAG: carboxynorspermidine decarboxylase [Acidimicrobiia bacterium]